MVNIVIAGAYRATIGKFDCSSSEVSVEQLGIVIIRNALERAGIFQIKQEQ